MKVLYYDCFCGISGDMNLAALVDLGVDEVYLRRELAKLQLDDAYELQIKKADKKGISGTRVEVILKQEPAGHDHKHEHQAHDQHSLQAEGKDAPRHVHRNLKDIEKLILHSRLSDIVKKRSLAIFRKVAEAEAKVHNKPLYEVHFHEVGAVDSLIDIVGAAVCLEYLNVDKIMASSVQLGGGFVKCAHGTMPVPAPATAEILKYSPVKIGIVPFETTTPTGAAILAANVAEFTEQLNFAIEEIGYGIGHRDLEIPNVLRIYLGSVAETEEPKIKNEQYILESNIDDMNPELYGYIEEKLFAQGALDVFKTAISMKKGRAATKLSVLVTAAKEEKVLEVIFRETTSIGIRKYPVEKIMMERDFVNVSTRYGTVTVKNAYYQGEKVKYKPEYEDCKRLASEKNIPIARVYQEVYKKIEADTDAT